MAIEISATDLKAMENFARTRGLQFRQDGRNTRIIAPPANTAARSRQVTTKEVMQGNVMKEIRKNGIKAFVSNLLGRKDTEKERRRFLQSYYNCVLPKEVHAAVEMAIIAVLNRHMFEEWGLFEHFEKGLTNSILLYGKPGTGKTMICESIAAILDKNLIKVSSGDIQSPMPGKTERNIRDVFANAKKNDAIIMFDECDSVLYDRDSVGPILGAETNTLLTEIERFEGTIVLTTNRLHVLDKAMQRRIMAKVHVPEPNKEARMQIWKNLLPPKMPIEPLDFDMLSDMEMTGGDIKNAIFLSAKEAISHYQDKVTKINVLNAVKSVLDSKNEYAKTRPRRVGEEEIRSSLSKVLRSG